MIYVIIAIVSLVAGYAIGTLRSQREAIAAKAQSVKQNIKSKMHKREA